MRPNMFLKLSLFSLVIISVSCGVNRNAQDDLQFIENKDKNSSSENEKPHAEVSYDNSIGTSGGISTKTYGYKIS